MHVAGIDADGPVGAVVPVAVLVCPPVQLGREEKDAFFAVSEGGPVGNLPELVQAASPAAIRTVEDRKTAYRLIVRIMLPS